MASQVFLQPASSPAAQRHYRDTIENSIPTRLIGSLLSPQQRSEIGDLLDRLSAVRVWGIGQGARGHGANAWTRLQNDDIGLFARQNRYFSSCRVIGKVRSAGLGERLWGRMEGGQTWEFIYFLDRLFAIDIPYAEFNRVIGAAENMVPLGFRILPPGQAAAAIGHFRFR